MICLWLWIKLRSYIRINIQHSFTNFVQFSSLTYFSIRIRNILIVTVWLLNQKWFFKEINVFLKFYWLYLVLQTSAFKKLNINYFILILSFPRILNGTGILTKVYARLDLFMLNFSLLLTFNVSLICSEFIWR